MEAKVRRTEEGQWIHGRVVFIHLVSSTSLAKGREHSQHVVDGRRTIVVEVNGTVGTAAKLSQHRAARRSPRQKNLR